MSEPINPAVAPSVAAGPLVDAWGNYVPRRVRRARREAAEAAFESAAAVYLADAGWSSAESTRPSPFDRADPIGGIDEPALVESDSNDVLSDASTMSLNGQPQWREAP